MSKSCIHFLFAILSTVLLTGFASASMGNVPSDFQFLLNAQSKKEGTEHFYIEINARGKGYFERYDTNGSISYDENDIIIVEKSQVIEKGSFQLADEEMEELWKIIEENNFFQLKEDYQMAIGFSYAFIIVEANGKKHQVDNIGMEVSEIRTIVEKADDLLPTKVGIEYGDGY